MILFSRKYEYDVFIKCHDDLGFMHFHICCSFGPYFVEPVIAGIDPITLEPFVANLDFIGCPMVATDFAVSGTCTEQMYGMCESLWVPDMV